MASRCREDKPGEASRPDRGWRERLTPRGYAVEEAEASTKDGGSALGVMLAGKGQ
jgi:hypothetical protein